MNSVITPNEVDRVAPIPTKPRRARRVLIVSAVIGVCLLTALGGTAVYRQSVSASAMNVPTVKVAQGDISLPIYALGHVRGGNSQSLTAPLTGGTELHILALKTNGAPVHAGDVVVQFDTTDQEFALKEAESDIAEAEQHIKQATSQFQADAEEARYDLGKAKSDLELARLEARKNPILSGIVAKQNDLAVEVARDKLSQLEEDSSNKKATGEAGIQIQEAARAKAESKMLTARQNIQAMTLRAERDGYVAVKQTQPNFFFGGNLPDFQVGDSARPGVAVAEIPDLSHWEVGANIGELDQGHLKVGDKVSISVIAVPGKTFRGHVADIGTSTGSVWNRHFECKVALDEQSPELRPGMSARVEITSETIRNALWLPAQALFESDGKKFVYLRSGNAFARRDITLVRRNETRVILTGLQAGQEVALANPTDATPKKARSGGTPLSVMAK